MHRTRRVILYIVILFLGWLLASCNHFRIYPSTLFTQWDYDVSEYHPEIVGKCMRTLKRQVIAPTNDDLALYEWKLDEWSLTALELGYIDVPIGSEILFTNVQFYVDILWAYGEGISRSYGVMRLNGVDYRVHIPFYFVTNIDAPRKKDPITFITGVLEYCPNQPDPLVKPAWWQFSR